MNIFYHRLRDDYSNIFIADTQANQLSVKPYRIVTSRSEPRISSAGHFLVEPVTDRLLDFLTNKEDLKAKLAYQGHLYRYGFSDDCFSP